MSYCRWGSDSAVYVYRSSVDGIVCCGCALGAVADDEFSITVSTPEEMIEHLEQHRAEGDAVPEYALERLRTEVANG